jgi:hypothetical protein
MQQSLVLWRTNNPRNIFILIVGMPAHISKLHTNNGVNIFFKFFSAATLQRKASFKPYMLAAVLYI